MWVKTLWCLGLRWGLSTMTEPRDSSPPLPLSCGRHGGGELPSFVEEMENGDCRAGEEQGVQLSGHQRDAEIPKDRIGDMPLTIALQGKLPVAVRWELAGQEVAS